MGCQGTTSLGIQVSHAFLNNYEEWINELAPSMECRSYGRMLGVTEDTVINWEMRGITPRRWNIEKIETLIAEFVPLKI